MARCGWVVTCLMLSSGAQAADDASRIERVQGGLLPAVTIDGQPTPHWSLKERMAHWGVPAVGIAVINDGGIEWARTYGVLEAGGAQEVNASTLFQAASISKPVTAAATLRLVELGRLDLGQAANSRLRSWKIPDDELVFAVEGGHLVARVEGAVLVLEAQSADRFFETEQGFTFVFEGAEGGQAAAVAYSFRGRRGRGRRVGAG